MKKKHILSVFILAIAILGTACGPGAGKASDPKPADSTMVEERIYVPEGVHSVQYAVAAEQPVSLHTEDQAKFIQDDYKKVLNYANGRKELSRPEGLTLSWSEWADGKSADSYLVKISENASMTNANEYTTAESEILVYNLKIDTEYFWTVTAIYQDSSVLGEVSSFRTSPAIIRNIYVDGVTNFRDLGGYDIGNGKTVKQGLIYRCGRLNVSDSEEVEVEITEQGKDTMLNELGIKSEIDLRRVDNNEVGGISSSVLGDAVNYFAVPMDYASRDFDNDPIKGNKEMIVYLFSILADENNYPLCFHCNIGTDRTGMVAYMVYGLLGVDKSDIYHDYLFSNFGLIGGPRPITSISEAVYVKHINKYDGATLGEKIYNCLVDIGVPTENIDSVVRILSTD